MAYRPPYFSRNYPPERRPGHIFHGRGFQRLNSPYPGNSRFLQHSNFPPGGFCQHLPSGFTGPSSFPVPLTSSNRVSTEQDISHGQSFELGSKTGSSQHLELFPPIPNVGSFVPPVQIPGLSVNSFHNSSVIANGSSGDFTNLSPSNVEKCQTGNTNQHSLQCSGNFSTSVSFHPNLGSNSALFDGLSSITHRVNPESIAPTLTLPPMNVPPPGFPPHWNSGPSLPQVQDEKLAKLSEFLSKVSFAVPKAKCKHELQLPEFRSALSECVIIIEEIQLCRNILKSQCDEIIWTDKMNRIFSLKKKLDALFSYIRNPHRLQDVLKKLQTIKKKRELKKRTKLKYQLMRKKKEQLREDHNMEIDKWLDSIKQKNLKDKREAEMKKEADNILLEVRKKIHEAKKTIEKLKAFEKLRNARQTNAAQKGLHVLPKHTEHFEEKMSILKRVMQGQLEDYEAEEKAMKVMLETEQEEENRWKLPPAGQEKLKALHRKQQKLILSKLFGDAEEPEITDPIYLFHQFQTSATTSIENLVNIRRQWDMYIDDDGDAVPQEWVTPAPPSSSNWEAVL